MSSKTPLAALAALAAIAATSAAGAAVLYDNGPASGAITGVNIGIGNQVADSFVLTQAATITGINFASWDYPTTSLTSVGYAIESSLTVPAILTSAPIASSTYLFTQQPNGYLIDENAFTTTPTTLSAGTYYLVLGQALGSGGYWDQNNGPSSSYGPFGQFTGQSESFQVVGTPAASVPEPSTWLLLIVGFGGGGVMLRRASAERRGAPLR